MRGITAAVLSIALMTGMCSCSFFRGAADRRAGFSKFLRAVKTHVRDGDWAAAEASLDKTRRAWIKIKPLVQVDIDHDYVNQIQDELAVLQGNVEGRSKPDALAGILLIEEIWDDLGSM
ncbi:MAG: DUF4363 family protein [Patescibacteria group bacterium]